jgi:hypothetical protein
MSEFEELLARYKRQEKVLEEALQRVRRVISAFEEARAAWLDAPEGERALEYLAKTFPAVPDGSPQEDRRVRGMVSPSDIAARVRLILLEANRPMKRGELVAELERLGIPLAGKDKNKNLGTILWRHPEQFVSLEKLGYWVRGVPLQGVYTPEGD